VALGSAVTSRKHSSRSDADALVVNEHLHARGVHFDEEHHDPQASHSGEANAVRRGPGVNTKVCVTVPSSTRAHAAKSERQRDAACIDLVPRGRTCTPGAVGSTKFHVRAKRTRPARPATSAIGRATLPSSTRAHFAKSERQRDEVCVHFALAKYAHEDRRDRDQLPRTRSAEEDRLRDATPCASTSPRRSRRTTRISATKTSGEHDHWERDAAQLDARARRQQRAPTLDAECIHAPR